MLMVDGAFLKSHIPTASRFNVRIQQSEHRARRKLHLELWELEPGAGEDERLDLDLGLDQIEDVD